MPAPRLSVIVPVHRQWDLVPELLAALAAQTLDPAAFELILVNNDAPAPPPLSLPAEIRVVDAPVPGAYAARNEGAAAARGVWLVFTDADCRPEPGWLAALAAATDAAGAAALPLLAGPVRMLPPAAPSPWATYDLVRGIPQAAYVARGYAATANLAVPRAVFAALGGFDARRRSGGDADLCRRAGRAGHPLALVEAAVVAHPCRADWALLATKARRIKGGQIAAGPLPRRVAWTLRTLAPPLADSRAYLAAAGQVSGQVTEQVSDHPDLQGSGAEHSRARGRTSLRHRRRSPPPVVAGHRRSGGPPASSRAV
ncbi:MAG TPA: glycosyltransferase, partial [Amaricoccus sp.]|nr:glycosyltransferase [Amaricoccus sp.]